MLKVIIGGIIILGIDYLYKLKKAGDTLQSNIVDVILKGISDGSFDLQMDIQFSNPGAVDLPLENIKLGVTIADTKLADINQIFLDKAYVIPKNNSAIIPIHIQTIKLKNLLQSASPDLKAMILNNQIPDHASVAGTVKVNGITIDYNSKVPFKKSAA
jgi:hypothetical protein